MAKWTKIIIISTLILYGLFLLANIPNMGSNPEEYIGKTFAPILIFIIGFAYASNSKKETKPPRSKDDNLLDILTMNFADHLLPFDQFDRMRSFLKDSKYVLRGDDSYIWKNMGNEFFKRKDYENALKCYGYAVQIQPNYRDALNNIGMTYKMLGRENEAKKIFTQINYLEQKK